MTEWISVNVVLHQGPSLTLYLFHLIVDVLSSGVKHEAPWCMLFSDDIYIVLCSTSRDVFEHKAENWRRVVKDRGLKISRKKSECMKFCDDRDLEVRLQGDILKRFDKFKYLVSTAS